MIGMNWKKSLVVAGVLAVAAAVPAFSQARTQSVVPPSVEMTTSPVVVAPVKKVSTKKLVHHKAARKTAVKKAAVKHKVSKKHTKLSTKKHTV